MIVVIPLIAFGLAEAGLRLAGFGSFPVYDVGGEIGYIPAASQSGAFMGRNRWQFNDRHMGNKENWSPSKHPDILLVGNSIVMGGNPFDDADKVASVLSRDLHGAYTVWSIACNGWTNVNELTWLEGNRDVVDNADIVVIEYMDGGLSQPAEWPGEDVFPARRPLILSLYMANKYLPVLTEGETPPSEAGALPPVGATDPAQLARFRRFVEAVSKRSRVLILLYPAPDDLADQHRWRRVAAPMTAICESTPAICVDVAAQSEWTDKLYRDGVHPTVEGNKILAGILAKRISVLAAAARS